VTPARMSDMKSSRSQSSHSPLRRWLALLAGSILGVTACNPAVWTASPATHAASGPSQELSLKTTPSVEPRTGAAITGGGQQIVHAGSQASAVGAAEYFTGRVRIDPLWPADKGITASGSLVTFEPGARSAWHTHPAGQRLVVVSGVGLTQEWGKAVQEIRPGDVVWCPPGIKHWHGATATTAMTHLAVSGTLDGKAVEWMEKVSDAQYQAR
jgi:quercetin dioxygenase-like cupin family protein